MSNHISWILVICLVPVLLMGCAEEATTATVVSGTTDDSSVADAVEGDTSLSEDGFQAQGKDSGGVTDTVEKEEDSSPVLACEEGEECDDGNPCTSGDVCTGAVCAGVPFTCDDDVSCTQDLCDGEGGCLHSVLSGFCYIDAVCREDGEAHPELPCLACVVPLSTTEWRGDDGLACSDGNACTEADYCASGSCVSGTGLTCDDGNACTADTCDEELGCVGTPMDAPCEDGNLCSSGDVCDGGACVSGTELLVCEDGKVCTDDACDTDVGCVFTANNAPCDDGDICTGSGVCGEGGDCLPGALVPLGCDDANPCTDEACDSMLGCVYLPNGAACDDGDPCSLDDVCVDSGCSPGLGTLECDDDNGCTSDVCQPFFGCAFIANFDPCDDGELCTVDDFCSEGACVGAAPLNCDDENVCTTDSCDSVDGCQHEDNFEPCDDGNFCTDEDVCSVGFCVGTPKNCDDGNPCTADACELSGGQCEHLAIASSACSPTITIFTPLRGQGFKWAQETTVVGQIATPAGEMESLTVNGEEVILFEENGTVFLHVIPIVHGMNLATVELTDTVGGVTRVTHSFFYSTEWLDVGGEEEVDDGLVIGMGQEVVDDGDKSLPVDDLATVFQGVAADISLGDLFNPNQKITTQSIPVLGDVDVYVTGISHDEPTVSLGLLAGALTMDLVINDVEIDLKLVNKICTIFGACTTTNYTADASASKVSVDSMMEVSVDPETGEVSVVATNTLVDVYGFDVQLNGSLAFLVNWLIDFFEGDFADEIESEVAGVVNDLLPGILEEALGSLELSESFDFPPLFGGNNEVTVDFSGALYSVAIAPSHLSVGMKATAWPQEIDINSDQKQDTLGSFQRAECLNAGSDPAVGYSGYDLEIGLHDDLFNRMLFAVWYGGGLEFPVSQEMLGEVDLATFGIEDPEVYVEFLAPPIVTSCNPTESLEIQIGDLRVYADINIASIPVEVDIYLSLRAEAGFQVVEGGSGPELGLTLSELLELSTDVQFVDPAQSGLMDVVKGLVEEQLVPLFLGTLSEGAIGGFPLPSLDLSALAGEGTGAALNLDLEEVGRVGGYSMLKGGVK